MARTGEITSPARRIGNVGRWSDSVMIKRHGILMKLAFQCGVKAAACDLQARRPARGACCRRRR